MTQSPYHDWCIDTIRFYRGLDLFTDGPFHGLSDAECQQLIEGEHATWYFNFFREATRAGKRFRELGDLEMVMIAKDESRVWALDSESVYRGEQFYRDAISKLKQISRGTFHPQNASEEWIESDLGVGGGLEQIIHVTFDLEGVKQHIWIVGWGDFAHPGFIFAINRLSSSSDQQFRIFGDDQDWTVICQTDAEVAAMVDRGHKCREMAGRGGLITYPDTDSIPVVDPQDRWLYVRRGFFKYDSGEFDGAWQDFSRASKLGVPELLYSKLAEIIKPEN